MRIEPVILAVVLASACAGRSTTTATRPVRPIDHVGATERGISVHVVAGADASSIRDDLVCQLARSELLDGNCPETLKAVDIRVVPDPTGGAWIYFESDVPAVRQELEARVDLVTFQ